MKINDKLFLETVEECTGNVLLTSTQGDQFNLKSTLTQYIVKVLGDRLSELELWCEKKEDEQKFLKLFQDHPELLK